MTDSLRIDGQKLQFHPRRVLDLIDAFDDWDKTKNIAPIYVELSPAGACSHRCKFCSISYLGYKTIFLDHAMLHDQLQEMGAMGVRSINWAGEGEPLLAKKINAMVASAHQAQIESGFTTNGVLLNKLNLDAVSWVKVSVNAGTRDTYAEIHQTNPKDWDRVWKNLADARSRRKGCTIGVQTLLLPENAEQMESLALHCRDAGVDYLVIKAYSQHAFSLEHTRQYENIDYAKYSHLEAELEALETEDFNIVFRAASMKAVSEAIPYSTCRSTPYLWAYAMADGSVYSCSAYLSDERFLLGNLNKQGFAEIWHGEARRANWELMKSLDIGNCRKACRMHQSNLYLNDLVNGVPHQNFI